MPKNESKLKNLKLRVEDHTTAAWTHTDEDGIEDAKSWVDDHNQK